MKTSTICNISSQGDWVRVATSGNLWAE